MTSRKTDAPQSYDVCSSADFQQKFGLLAQKVRRGTPLVVTNYGRPDLMVLSFEMAEAALNALADQTIREAKEQKEARKKT